MYNFPLRNHCSHLLFSPHLLLLFSPPSSGGGPALVRVPVQVLLSAPVEPPAYGPHGQQELPTKPCGTQGKHPNFVFNPLIFHPRHEVSCCFAVKLVLVFVFTEARRERQYGCAFM